MPWRDTSIMDERVFFINEYRSGAWTVTDLCQEFQISRTLGYRYINRFELHGMHGLLDLPSTPHSSPKKTPKPIENAILKLRSKHPWYGPEKLQTKLSERYPDIHWPALSTVNLILKRHGMIPKRHRIRRIVPVQPIFNPSAPNQIWSGNFKGKYRIDDHTYVYLLTIADSYSRFVFAAQALLHPTFEATKAVFTRVLREYGMPRQLHTDNGSSFAGSTSLARPSSLAVWILEHDVYPVYSDPGCPGQNGRHERMHRELKAEIARRPASNCRLEQKRLHAFVKEYNTYRPHKALNNKTPASVHVRSQKEYSSKAISWDYPKEYNVYRVCKNGAIRWGSENWIMVSTPLIGKDIGLFELGNAIWRVFFRGKLLGYLDERIMRINDVQGRSIRYNKV